MLIDRSTIKTELADGCFGEMLDLEKELRGEGVTGMRDEESAASGAAPMEH